METFKDGLEVLWKFLFPVALWNIIFYFAGSFIAWDFNLTNWVLFYTWYGRAVFLGLELFSVATIPSFWEEWEKL